MNARTELRAAARQELRRTIQSPMRALATMSEEAVGQSLGLRHQGLVRRIMRSRRLASRVATRLISTGHMQQAALNPPPPVRQSAPQSPTTSSTAETSAVAARAPALSPALQDQAIHYAGLAVAVRAMGGLLAREDYMALVERHGDHAVAFALLARAKAPSLSLQSAAPADEAIRRFGATCLAALGAVDAAYASIDISATQLCSLTAETAPKAAETARRAIETLTAGKGEA